MKRKLFDVEIFNKIDNRNNKIISVTTGDAIYTVENNNTLILKEDNSGNIVDSMIFLPEKQDIYYDDLPLFAKGVVNSKNLSHFRNRLWSNIEGREKRDDGQFCRRFTLTIDKFFDLITINKMVNNFVAELKKEGMVIDYTLKDNNSIYSAYLLTTLRRYEKGVLGKKIREWNTTDVMISWRNSWYTILLNELNEAKYNEMSNTENNIMRLKNYLEDYFEKKENYFDKKKVNKFK